jgi:anti-sigma factor RsiW
VNLESQLNLQAYLDGELPAGERRRVEASLAADAAARGLLAELEQTCRALKGNELPAPLGESREFYWSQIRRQIEHSERGDRPAASASGWSYLRRWLVPAAGVAATLLVLLVAVNPWAGGRGVAVETALTDSGALTYRDHARGITLVWFSYPGETEGPNLEFAESQKYLYQ